MSNWYQTIVDVEVSEDDAAEAAAKVVAWLVERGIVVEQITNCTSGGGREPGPNYAEAVVEPGDVNLAWNGLHAAVGRVVTYSNDPEQSVSCPHCAFEIGLEPMHEVISEWFDLGGGTRSCPGCARELQINDWRWNPAWGFGSLSLTFWNWPELRRDFIAEVTALLGHRTVYVADTL